MSKKAGVIEMWLASFCENMHGADFTEFSQIISTHLLTVLTTSVIVSIEHEKRVFC